MGGLCYLMMRPMKSILFFWLLLDSKLNIVLYVKLVELIQSLTDFSFSLFIKLRSSLFLAPVGQFVALRWC